MQSVGPGCGVTQILGNSPPTAASPCDRGTEGPPKARAPFGKLPRIARDRAPAVGRDHFHIKETGTEIETTARRFKSKKIQEIDEDEDEDKDEDKDNGPRQ